MRAAGGHARGAQLEGAQLAAEAVGIHALPSQQSPARVCFRGGVHARRARLQLPRHLRHLRRVARHRRVRRRVQLYSRRGARVSAGSGKRRANPRARRNKRRSRRKRPRSRLMFTRERAPPPRCPPTAAAASSGPLASATPFCACARCSAGGPRRWRSAARDKRADTPWAAAGVATLPDGAWCLGAPLRFSAATVP